MARRSPRTLQGCAWVACAALCACANPGAGVSGEDSDGTFTGLRATWEVPRPMLEGGAPPPRQLLLQVEAGTHDASDAQSVPAGETIVVDGAQFVGPTGVQLGWDLQQASADARLRLRGESLLGLDLIGGVGFARIELDASATGIAASDEDNGFGPRFGLGLFCEPQPRLRLFVEGAWQPTFVGGGDVADLQAIDLGLEYRLTDSIELGLGWRRQAWRQEQDAGSDLDLEASGPRLALALRF